MCGFNRKSLRPRFQIIFYILKAFFLGAAILDFLRDAVEGIAYETNPEYPIAYLSVGVTTLFLFLIANTVPYAVESLISMFHENKVAVGALSNLSN